MRQVTFPERGFVLREVDSLDSCGKCVLYRKSERYSLVRSIRMGVCVLYELMYMFENSFDEQRSSRRGRGRARGVKKRSANYAIRRCIEMYPPRMDLVFISDDDFNKELLKCICNRKTPYQITQFNKCSRQTRSLLRQNYFANSICFQNYFMVVQLFIDE